MTFKGYYTDELPSYYSTMYLDGYTPAQILEARHQSMYEELTQDADTEGYEVHITSEVRLK